eukprot:6837078-Prymnesium_polylepis.1
MGGWAPGSRGAAQSRPCPGPHRAARRAVPRGAPHTPPGAAPHPISNGLPGRRQSSSAHPAGAPTAWCTTSTAAA